MFQWHHNRVTSPTSDIMYQWCHQWHQLKTSSFYDRPPSGLAASVVYRPMSVRGWPELPRKTLPPILASWGFVTLCRRIGTRTKTSWKISRNTSERRVKNRISGRPKSLFFIKKIPSIWTYMFQIQAFFFCFRGHTRISKNRTGKIWKKKNRRKTMERGQGQQGQMKKQFKKKERERAKGSQNILDSCNE